MRLHGEVKPIDTVSRDKAAAEAYSGRPMKAGTQRTTYQRLTFRVTSLHLDALDEAAERQQITRSEALRQALQFWLEWREPAAPRKATRA